MYRTIQTGTRLKCHYSTISKAIERLGKLGDGKVHLELDTVSEIVLDHPQKKNALSGVMMVQLEEAVAKLEKWGTGKAVILKSTGDLFCSGGDLTTVKEIANPEDGRLMCEFMQNITSRLLNLHLVSICLVQGKAIGGGAELITCADFRAFSSQAEVKFVQGVMGVSTGWGGGTRLANLVGFSKALDMLLTSKSVKPDEAYQIGLCDLILDHNRRDLELETWLSKRLRHDSSIIHALKKTTAKSRELAMQESLKNECNHFSPLWGGPAQLEALGLGKKH